MKKLLFLLLILNVQAKQFIFEARNPDLREYGKIKCQLLCLGDTEIATKIGTVLRQDLEFTDQLEVDVKKAESDLPKKTIAKLFKKGVSVYCSLDVSKGKVEVKLQDTSTNRVIIDKSFTCDTENPVACGNHISAHILPQLTSEPSVTLHDLAFCKLLSPSHKVICVSNYDAKNSKVVASMNTVNIAPSWHGDRNILFYSQLTRQNTRLMVVDLSTNRHRVVCSFEGLNMQPSVSRDGGKVVLCLSRSGNSELYLYDAEVSKQKKRRVFRQITRNGGTNVSPQLLVNDDIIFCSDFKTGSPQVFYLDMTNNKIRQLTNGGYCGSPTYCEKNHSVAYTKPVDGTFQLFKVALNDDHSVESEEQLTFNEGDKHNPTWSGCGKYVAFSYRVADEEDIRTTQIAVLNNSSGKIRVLTGGREAKSFPTWRNRYT